MRPTPSRLCLLAALAVGLLPLQAQGKKGDARPVSGVPFVSTQFDDDVQGDQVNGPLRLHLTKWVTLSGVETLSDLNGRLAQQLAEPMAAKGLVLMSKKEVEAAKKFRGGQPSPLTMAGKDELIYRHKDAAALKSFVEKITFIGSRQSGRLSGTIDAIYVSICASNAEFGGGGARFRPQILVRGLWHGVVNATFPKSTLMDGHLYSSDVLAKDIVGIFGASSASKAAADLEKLGVVLAGEAKAMAEAWFRMAAEKHYEGKLPAQYVKNEGLDGSWEALFGEMFRRLDQSLKEDGDAKKAMALVDKVDGMLRRALQSYRTVKKGGTWPTGFDPEAGWDAVQLLNRHKTPMAAQIEDVRRLLKEL